MQLGDWIPDGPELIGMDAKKWIAEAHSIEKAFDIVHFGILLIGVILAIAAARRRLLSSRAARV
jgi:hypothetical protein